MRTKIIAKELIVKLSYGEIRDTLFAFAFCVKQSISSSFKETDYTEEIIKIVSQVEELSAFATKCTEKIMAAYSQGVSKAEKAMKQPRKVDIGIISPILKQLSDLLPQENYEALLNNLKSSGIDKVLQIKFKGNDE